MSAGNQARSIEKGGDPIVGEEMVATLKEDIAALKRDLETLKADVVTHGRLAGSAAADRLEAEIDALNDKASQVLGDARRKTEETADDFRTSVRKNPMSSVGAALAVGVVVGQFLGRR